MTAVSTIDTVGGLVLAVGAGLWLIVTGIRDRARSTTSGVETGAASLPSVPRQARSVEAGTFVAADATCREGVAGRSSRSSSAATPIEAVRITAVHIETLTFPGPYSQIGTKR